MSDHQDYCYSFINEINIKTQDIGDSYGDSENVIGTEKSGDDFLIELYRERPFLYDKKNPNFKDTSMKQNAWNEISKTMIETNCGDFYTPSYCQRKCTSLREQYNREKKRMGNQSKSGSAAPNSKSRQFSLYSKLTSLDQVIKRRRTYNNVTKSQSDVTVVDDNALESKTNVSDDDATCSLNNKENQGIKNQEVNTEDSNSEISVCSPKQKRGKVNETKELEQTFLNMSNRIMNYPTNTEALYKRLKTVIR